MERIFLASMGPKEARPDIMKTRTKKAKPGRNGKIPSRQELLAAHARVLQRMEKMTAEEGFKALVRAGIYTPEGKLTPRYGG